jgi:hypothetical protein|tara:strand:+ start:35 stop:763 length:729 start_codon:yes stop_codon:yes gene_type:complete
MSYDPNTNNYATTASRASSTTFDAGLQAHMQKVYKLMMYGLSVTGLTAYAVSQSDALLNLVFNTPLYWVALLAPLAIIWFGFTPRRVFNMSKQKVRGIFYLLSFLYGLTFSVIFIQFTAESIARVFFITAGTFGAMSLIGYTTKRDLSALGSFLIMGIVGIIIAGLVNLIFASTLVSLIVSVLGVMIFTLMVAVDTQRIKETYSYGYGETDNDKMATLGAFSLYLNFIIIFQNLMYLFGNQR